MPKIATAAFILALRGFRPVIVTYEPPKFGGHSYTILKVCDKYPPPSTERVYDLGAALRNNDFDALISRAHLAILEPEKTMKKKPKPRAATSQEDLPL
jgi:hypothetical protein